MNKSYEADNLLDTYTRGYAIININIEVHITV